MRFRTRNSQQMGRFNFSLGDAELEAPSCGSSLVDGELEVRDGLVVRVALCDLPIGIVGYRAIKNGSVIDVDRPQGYAAEDFWEPIHARPDERLVLDPDSSTFWLRERKCKFPPTSPRKWRRSIPRSGSFASTMPDFFDPGFGRGADGRPAARAVLEVRSSDVPFFLEDGQPVGRPASTSNSADATDELYGAGLTSNYQHQGLKLSKHFRG